MNTDDPLNPHGDDTLRPGDFIYDAAMRGNDVYGERNDDGWNLQEIKDADQRRLDAIDREMGYDYANLQDYGKGERAAGFGPVIQPGEYATRKEWLLVAMFITVLLAIGLFVATMILWSPEAEAAPDAGTCELLSLDPTVENLTAIVLDMYLRQGFTAKEAGEAIATDVALGCSEYVPILREFVYLYAPEAVPGSSHPVTPNIYLR